MRRDVAHEQLDQPITDFLRRDFVALRADQTVHAALEHLRGQNLGERVVYFYVTDADGRLVGVLPTRRLLMGSPDARLETLMRPGAVVLPASATLLLACELFVMYRLLALPVVDDDNRLIGLVDISLFTEEVSDLSARHEADDVFQLIGVRLAASRDVSAWSGFRRRFPWLLCNVAGGVACAFLAGRYEAFLDSVIVLALFIPVVLAIAESVSMQSTTLTLQALHHGRVDWRFLARRLLRELRTAVLLGIATGVVVGLVALAWKNAGLVAVAISGTILFSVVTACALGVLLPTIVRALRGDPKFAAGPVVLATADLLTLLMYFNLAAALLD